MQTHRSKSAPQKKSFQGSENTVETGKQSVGGQLADIPMSVTRTMWKDFFEAALKKTAPDQVLGNEIKEKHQNNLQSGDLTEGQAISLQEQTETVTQTTAEHRDYFRSVDKIEQNADQRENMETSQQIEMLQVEIKKLIKASKEMETAFKEVSNQVTVESSPKEIGKYHLNFLEWVLITVRNARVRIEEGQAWMSMFANKKQQKQSWSMTKKVHDVNLNNERSITTQTG